MGTQQSQQTIILTQQQQKKLSKQRKEELYQTILNKLTVSSDPNEREEWMLQPGKHDFLQSIKRQPITKERKFLNIKSKDSQNQEEINPIIQEEINKLKQVNESLRGPSLLEQYTTTKNETKNSKDNKNWKWNRENNLMDGRRVDKNALKMVL